MKNLLMLILIVLAVGLSSCGRDRSHHFENQQATESAPEYNYEVTMSDGKVLRAKTLVEASCGVRIEGTDDGQNYTCLQNVKWKKLNNESCGCGKGGAIVVLMIISFLVILFIV